MTDTTTGQRVYRNPLTDIPDQYLFFGFFLVGAAAIWSLKAYGFSQYLVTSIPVALMLVYSGIALMTKRYRIREDRVGDNVYYLGFLFTLVSLGYALHVYSPDGAGASEIITNFGIALATTIVGLALRVFFNQMREDPVEYEREARLSLAEASSALRAQLFNISTDVASFKRAMLQSTEEGMTEVANSVRTSMDANVKRFAEAAEDVVGKIQTAFEAFSDHSQKLNDIAGKNVYALEALFQRIEHIEAAPGLISQKIDPILGKFEEVADEAMRRNRNQTNDLKRIKEIIDASTEASETLRTTLSGIDEGLKSRIDTFGTSLAGAAKLAEQFTASLNGATAAFSAEIAAAERLAAQIGDQMHSQQVQLVGVKASLVSELDQMRQFKSEISRMAEESASAVRMVQDSLVTLSKNMVEQLGDGRRRS
jgi:hypothetical protein